jgi:hypothetical protein
MSLLAFFSLDFEVAGFFSSSSMDNSSLITDKLFESTSLDTETEEISNTLLDDSSKIEEFSFFATFKLFSLNFF